MGRIINLTEGMRFGASVDGITEEVRGLPIDYDGITYDEGGQYVSSWVKTIESQESLMESLNLSINTSARYGLASGDAKFSMAQQHSVNHYSLYVLLNADVRNPPKHMIRPRLSVEALQIYRNDPERFRQIYGDVFIDEIYGGGDFFGLFIFEAYDERSRTDIKASLDLSINSFLVGGEIQASFGYFIEEAKKKSKMEIRVIMAGGVGLENPSKIDDLLRLYKTFNAKVSEHPIDYKASVKDFRYLPLPEGPSWGEQAVRRDVIEQCGRRVLEGIRLRGDIGFILRYPGQFENPDLDGLKTTYQEIDAQLPKLAGRARECSQNIDKCSLGGIAPIVVPDLPKRLANAGDPLQQKWDYILSHGENRAKPYFQKEGLNNEFGGIEDYTDGPRGGRYKLFYDNSSKKPIGGIFWHPDRGAQVVYGDIMQKYLALNHCKGHLGYPKTDEDTLRVSRDRADGVDRRISYFEHGYLWWDGKTSIVSEELPFDLMTDFQKVMNRPIPKLDEVVLKAGKQQSSGAGKGVILPFIRNTPKKK